MTQVTIFVKPGCPHCAGAKQDLARRGIAYTEHDVTADPAALLRMLELNGGRRHVPTILQDGQVTVGFQGH